jgi:hypothetical protein
MVHTLFYIAMLEEHFLFRVDFLPFVEHSMVTKVIPSVSENYGTKGLIKHIMLLVSLAEHAN